uniref:Sec-independent translocase component C n=1 Tax=Haramonas pauciplastida TaxID=478668 RepID=UPI0021139DD4|nr:Sec-independent translocase component C [Haramonas pauciplastida]UTE95013.1 Sec-independent translocase component C [Haramonas pauciplastida]
MTIFQFKKVKLVNLSKNVPLDLFFVEHLKETGQRSFHFGIGVFCIILITFLNINIVTKFLQLSTSNIKFFQLSPGDYLVVTLKTSFFLGLINSSPLFVEQLILFLFPSFTVNEFRLIKYLILSVTILFLAGLVFAYFILIPTALGFFFNYSNNILEPFLSFNQYIEFISLLFFTTGLLFQLPIVQALLALFSILSPKKMLKLWKWIIIASTIVSAIVTPSADPFTQLLLSLILLLLYAFGVLISFYIVENKSLFND